MNNSLIYMINNGASSVLANGIIPLTTIARRRCKCIQNDSNSIILNAVGYYKVNATITLTAPEAGVVSVELQKNGTVIPGMVGSTTITTADTEVRQVVINGIVRVGCCEGAVSLTLANTGVSITTSNVSIDVEYLD